MTQAPPSLELALRALLRKAEGYFPDDTSKREGYLLALEDVLGFFEGPRIITSHVYPPIPTRNFDWCAYRDGSEEQSGAGHGATEAEAVADLLANEERA